MKGSRIIGPLLSIILIPALLACAPRDGDASSPSRLITSGAPVLKQQPEFDAAKLEGMIHDRINRERRARGLAALRWDDALSRIAGEHSRDMAKRGYFSHVSPEGRGFSQRYRAGGYTCGITVKNVIYTGAENIFQNNLYDRITTVNGVKYYDWNSMEEIADTTVEGWMNSPGHRKNILMPHWEREGIGISVAPDDKVYITQNFC